jgi:hypothetical protein
MVKQSVYRGRWNPKRQRWGIITIGKGRDKKTIRLVATKKNAE